MVYLSMLLKFSQDTVGKNLGAISKYVANRQPEFSFHSAPFRFSLGLAQQPTVHRDPNDPRGMPQVSHQLKSSE